MSNSAADNDDSNSKAEATTFIMELIKEKEITKLIAENKIDVLKEMILEEGKGKNEKSFIRMRQVQWLESQRSKAIQDINALSDLVQELWSEEDFEPDLDYIESAKKIIDRPAVRIPGCDAKAKRRSSYGEMQSHLENVRHKTTQQLLK
jgi:hypothetical protein